MTELSQTILNECREEVAKEYGHDSWQEVEQSTRWSHKDDLHEEAALLAMEKQAEFYRWASREYWYADNVDRWISVDDLMRENQITELELYDIWREGK